jgi:hypothetical protein
MSSHPATEYRSIAKTYTNLIICPDHLFTPLQQSLGILDSSLPQVKDKTRQNKTRREAQQTAGASYGGLISFESTSFSNVGCIYIMASFAGGIIFVVISLLVISLAVLLVLRHYLPLRTTPAYLLTPVFLALALPVSLTLLVPIDLASSLRDDGTSGGIWLPENALLVAWRIAYWLTFSLTW